MRGRDGRRWPAAQRSAWPATHTPLALVGPRVPLSPLEYCTIQHGAQMDVSRSPRCLARSPLPSQGTRPSSPLSRHPAGQPLDSPGAYAHRGDVADVGPRYPPSWPGLERQSPHPQDPRAIARTRGAPAQCRPAALLSRQRQPETRVPACLQAASPRR